MAQTDYRLGWMEDDEYWRTNYSGRPYASTGGQDYTFYQPAYRYGFESAHRYEGRNWNDIESQLATDWTTYERLRVSV